MGIRTAVAAQLSTRSRLRISRFLRGELGWQRATSAAALALRTVSVPPGFRVTGTLRAPVFGRVVDQFDSWSVRHETAAAIVETLRTAGVPYAVLGDRPVRVVVSGDEGLALRAALATLTGPEWTV